MNGGVLALGSAASAGATRFSIGGGGAPATLRFGGSFVVANDVYLASGKARIDSSGADTGTLTGTISAAPGVGLRKTGSGTLVLASTIATDGETSVEGGTLAGTTRLSAVRFGRWERSIPVTSSFQ